MKIKWFVLMIIISTNFLFAKNIFNYKNKKIKNKSLNSIQIFKLSYKLEKERKINLAINELLTLKNLKYKYLLYYRIGYLYHLLYKYKQSN